MKKNNIITSGTNKLIKDIKLLHKKKGRWKEKCFFIEGIRSIEQCMSSRGEIKHIVYSSDLLGEDGIDLLKDIEDKDYNIYEVTEKLFKEISDTDTPQGLLAVVEFKEYKLEDCFKEKNFFIILDRVQDPGNLGTIIRTADAFGANGVIVTSGCVDVYNPKTIRSTMGSIFQIPIIHIDDILESISRLKDENISVISSSLATEKYLYDIDFKSDCALVIGNEAKGISEYVVEASDQLVKIPMSGDAESLNAAIASGVLMYEVLRQRSVACNFKSTVL